VFEVFSYFSPVPAVEGEITAKGLTNDKFRLRLQSDLSSLVLVDRRSGLQSERQHKGVSATTNEAVMAKLSFVSLWPLSSL